MWWIEGVGRGDPPTKRYKWWKVPKDWEDAQVYQFDRIRRQKIFKGRSINEEGYWFIVYADVEEGVGAVV